MKRDLELCRSILLKIEADPKFDGRREHYITSPTEFPIEGHSWEDVDYDLNLLIEEGMIDGKMTVDPGAMIRKLSWKGHEFLNDTRDPDIWSKTK